MTAQPGTQGVRRQLWRACLVTAAALWWLLLAGEASHAEDDVLPVAPATESATSSTAPVVETAAAIVESGTTIVESGPTTAASQPPAQLSPSKPVAPPVVQRVTQPATRPVTQAVRQLVQRAPEPVQPVVREVVSPLLDSVEQAAAPSEAPQAVGLSASQADTQGHPQANSHADPGLTVTDGENVQGGARQDGKPQAGARTDKHPAGALDANSALHEAPRRLGSVAGRTNAPRDVRAESVRTAAQPAVRDVPESEVPSSHPVSDLPEEQAAGTERPGSPGGAAAHLQGSSDFSPLGSAAPSTSQVQTPPRDRAGVPDYRPD